MRAVLWMALATLAACSRESERAKEELAIVENAHSSGIEICEAKRRVAAALLKEQNAKEYEVAKMGADASCLLARLDPTYAMLGTKEIDDSLTNDISVP